MGFKWVDILNLTKKLAKEDEEEAKNIGKPRMFFGYIHFCNVIGIQVLTFKESAVRLYHKFIKRDYLLFDATGGLFKNICGNKRQLYYALCLRHPFKNETLCDS